MRFYESSNLSNDPGILETRCQVSELTRVEWVTPAYWSFTRSPTSLSD